MSKAGRHLAITIEAGMVKQKQTPNMDEGLKLLNVIQDVYLADEVTVA